ncbi:GIY-YIG nuclease family protein [Sphingobacterium rhinopitheci]|uniref:hypothetical protein n=1 Tax=Sphingobacterium rhinopitheci TaxID=2781960 RepID=UPI001F51EC84|nr:hypothetical protein [Sphingobacterium rhinopitheci]MCI0921278.1 hypothetical protein [Sphingobacterium rhinopitheci]
MQRHFIFITSDSNRIYLEAGYCQDICLQLFELQQASSLFMAKAPKFNRIVYVEEFSNPESAQRRKVEINSYTKMQKERLIRKNNPNWLGITNTEVNSNKKVVVFA